MSAVEQEFMQAVDAFSVVERNLQPLLQSMQSWLAELVEALQGSGLDASGVQAGSALAEQMQAINRQLQAGERRWASQWDRLRPAQALAQSFDDKAMLLVFGKFNAGKSSLCNLLAERFGQQGRSVRYFYVQDGQLVMDAPRLREGATETTTRLQGVCLGDKLLLLDTPGLHSGTAANAALTQRFLDSADGVLWLTSSTSPGQVQELDELTYELRRSKPVLPVVTRSDCIEEDEVDGAIVKCLCNKTEAVRAMQEADVLARAEAKLVSMGLGRSLLRTPVSVSVLVARAQEQTDEAMAAAGCERLYAALLALTGPALAYKQRKPAEVVLHHLQEQVLGELQAQMAPALQDLRQALQMEAAALTERPMQIVQLAWREVIPALPALLDSQAEAGDLQGVCNAVNARVDAALARQLEAQLGDYVLPLVAPAGISLADCRDQREVVGQQGPAAPERDQERLYYALEQAVRSQLMERATGAVKVCRAHLTRAEKAVLSLQELLAFSGQQLQQIEQALRA